MKTFVIAEIGVNHNGSIQLAKKMIKIAKFCGADAVKFQSFIASNLVSNKARLANYQKKSFHKDSMIDLLKKYELTYKTQIILYKFCKKIKIEFLSSAFDEESLDFLISKLKVEKIKIPSGELNNLPLLVRIAKAKKTTFLSTGMANLKEIKTAIKILNKNGLKKSKLTIMHCNSAYPTPMKDANLRSIIFLKKKLGMKTGYSDHTLGLESPIAAVTLGAEVIEKHFTLNKKLKGPDHSTSLMPKEFKQMISYIRNIEKGLGVYSKIVTKSEKVNINFVRKSVVAKKNILKGEKFKISNITTKRPGHGISPFQWNKVLGQKALKNFKKDELIFI